MSTQELFEIAQERIDRRNRRWKWWAFDLAGLIMSVAVMILLVQSPLRMVGVAVMIAWAGIFVLHTITAAMAHSRDEDIANEIAKLRGALEEKPKRVYLSDDGEIAESQTDEGDEAELEPTLKRKAL